MFWCPFRARLLAAVAAIAVKGGINANPLFKWRREHVRVKTEPASAAATLLPVCVVPKAEPAPTSWPPTAGGAAARVKVDVASVMQPAASLRLTPASHLNVLRNCRPLCQRA